MTLLKIYYLSFLKGQRYTINMIQIVLYVYLIVYIHFKSIIPPVAITG